MPVVMKDRGRENQDALVCEPLGEREIVSTWCPGIEKESGLRRRNRISRTCEHIEHACPSLHQRVEVRPQPNQISERALHQGRWRAEAGRAENPLQQRREPAAFGMPRRNRDVAEPLSLNEETLAEGEDHAAAVVERHRRDERLLW